MASPGAGVPELHGQLREHLGERGVVAMSVMTAIILFSALGAVICTKARAAGPALFFGALAVALLSATPVGAQLREFFVVMAEQAGRAAAESGGAR